MKLASIQAVPFYARDLDSREMMIRKLNEVSARLVQLQTALNFADAVDSSEITTEYTDGDTSTSFTVGPGHAGTVRRFTSGSAITVTLPNSTPTGWTVGQSMIVIRGGTGTLTFTSTGTIRTPRTSAITSQHGKALVMLAASGVWELAWDI